MINLTLKEGCQKVTSNPYKYITYSLGTTFYFIIAVLVMQVAFLLLTQSYRAAITVLCSASASALAEAIYYYSCKYRHMNHTWRASIIQGLLTGLLIPSAYPLYAVFLIVLATFLCGKIFFGEFSDSWINLTALCVIIMYFLNADLFPSTQISLSDLQSKNASLALIQGGSVRILNCDFKITEFLNTTVFKILGVSIPDGYVSFFWDNCSEIPAFRFNFFLMISSIVFFSLNLIESTIPVIFLIVYSVLVRFAGPVFVNGIPMQGDMILSLMTGGTLFTAIFLLQWYGTTPMTSSGKFFYSVFSGITAFFVMGFGTSAIGYAFTILLMNLISTVIQVFEDKKMQTKVIRNIMPHVNELKEVYHD